MSSNLTSPTILTSRFSLKKSAENFNGMERGQVAHLPLAAAACYTLVMVKGDISVGFVAMALMKSGKTVLMPLTYNVRYDLLIDEGGSFLRVQCKTGRLVQDGTVLAFNACSTNHRGERKSYVGDIDFFGVHFDGRVFLVPVGKQQTAIWLRMLPPRGRTNSKNKSIRYARDFEVGA